MIQLNYRDSKPIYEQIKDGLRKLVISNSLSADEKLPSVRNLRRSLQSTRTRSRKHTGIWKVKAIFIRSLEKELLLQSEKKFMMRGRKSY